MFVYKYDAITNEYIEPMTAMVHSFFIRRLSGCCTVQG